MSNITVVDCIMGSGKTEAMLQMINETPDEKYIYIVPYLTEVERVKKKTNLREPLPYKESKIDNFDTLLNQGRNIVSTHALFLNISNEIINLIKDGEYTLILDEALDVFKDYNESVKNYTGKSIDKGTVKWLQKEGHISVDEDYSVSWNSREEYEDFQFSMLIEMSLKKTLYCIDDTLFWLFDPRAFTVFDNVFVLTYQHKGTLFDSYLGINGLEYTLKSIMKDENGYQICDYYDDYRERAELAKLINIYDGKLNNIGNRANSLSINNLMHMNKEQIKEIHDNMIKYKYLLKVKHNRGIMWTTSKRNDFYKKLKSKFTYTRPLTSKDTKYIGKKPKADEEPEVEEQKVDEAPETEKTEADKKPENIECFVSCNCRGTNDYAERNVLLYILNRYLHPETEKYFNKMGYPLDKDIFAQNELIQWIFRSAIRKGEKINIYIPSKRMRTLLYKWLDVDSPRTKTLEKRCSYGIFEPIPLKKKKRKILKKEV